MAVILMILVLLSLGAIYIAIASLNIASDYKVKMKLNRAVIAFAVKQYGEISIPKEYLVEVFKEKIDENLEITPNGEYMTFRMKGEE